MPTFRQIKKLIDDEKTDADMTFIKEVWKKFYKMEQDIEDLKTQIEILNKQLNIQKRKLR